MCAKETRDGGQLTNNSTPLRIYSTQTQGLDFRRVLLIVIQVVSLTQLFRRFFHRSFTIIRPTRLKPTPPTPPTATSPHIDLAASRRFPPDLRHASSDSDSTPTAAPSPSSSSSPLPFHQGNYMEFAPRITVVGCGGAGGNAGGCFECFVSVVFCWQVGRDFFFSGGERAGGGVRACVWFPPPERFLTTSREKRRSGSTCGELFCSLHHRYTDHPYIVVGTYIHMAAARVGPSEQRADVVRILSAFLWPIFTFSPAHSHPPSLITSVIPSLIPSLLPTAKSEQYDCAQPQGRGVHGVQHGRAAPVNNAYRQPAAAGEERHGGPRLRRQPRRRAKGIGRGDRRFLGVGQKVGIGCGSS